MRPGQRIGKYVIGQRIAVGGMAEVWDAHVEGPRGFRKPVALKFILESFTGDPELERLFVREARRAARLQHANVVAVFDFDKITAHEDRALVGRYYIAMERVAGHDLRRTLQAAARAGALLPVPLALYVAGEVLKGLRYVHERRESGRAVGLVHRDVSPHNVLVGAGGEVKLSDFGIAKAIGPTHATRTGTIRGKLSYASPEQLNGEDVDHRTDQFALGVTLWEMLAGKRLFDGPDELDIIAKVLRCEAPPLAGRAGPRAVSPAVDAVVRRMLSPEREARFGSTGEALHAVLSLPEYHADGSALGELVRRLFGDQSSEPNAGAGVAGRSARRVLAPTRTLDRRAKESGAPDLGAARRGARSLRAGSAPARAVGGIRELLSGRGWRVTAAGLLLGVLGVAGGLAVRAIWARQSARITAPSERSPPGGTEDAPAWRRAARPLEPAPAPIAGVAAAEAAGTGPSGPPSAPDREASVRPANRAQPSPARLPSQPPVELPGAPPLALPAKRSANAAPILE